MDIDYRLSLNVLKALGGNTDVPYESVEEIWDTINGIYDNAGDRLDIEALILDIKNNGLYEYYPSENADAYAPVRLNVNIPQKYTEEYIQELEKSVFQEGYNEGNEEGYKNGYTAGNTDGYTDGYAEGLDDGTEQQKSLLEETTFKDNGVYEKADGWNKVTVEVDIPTFETEALSVELTENGTHTYTPTTDGYSSVEVIVDVPPPAGARDYAEEMGFPSYVNDIFNEDIDGIINATKSLEAAYVKPTNGSLKQFYKGKTDLKYAPNIDTSGIRDFGRNRYESTSSSDWGTFYGCGNLLYVPALDMSSAKYCGYIFGSCNKLKKIEPMDWSNVTNISAAFDSCLNLETVPFTKLSDDLQYTSNAFWNCQKLKSVPQMNMSKTTNCVGMFSNCRELSCPIDLDMSSCTAANYFSSGASPCSRGMFERCIKLTDITLRNINADCKVLSGMFYHCENLNNLNMTFADGFAPTKTDYMFYFCRQLGTLPETFNTSKVTDCRYMFYHCENLKTMPFVNFPLATYIDSMYNGCMNIESFGGDLCFDSAKDVSNSFLYGVSCEIPNISLASCTRVYEIFSQYKGSVSGDIYCPKATAINFGLNKTATRILETVGVVDCSACTSLIFFTDYSSKNIDKLKNLGGFTNLGMASGLSNMTSSTSTFAPLSGLTRESMLNIINKLYDRKTAGYSTVTIKFNPTPMSLLTEDEIAIATNKGFTLTT